MKPRYFGPGCLVAASVFGGVPAACWLMAHNEALRERGRWVPWQPIALLFLTVEAIFHALIWNRLVSREWLVASWLLPVVALCVIARWRYARQLPRTIPAAVTDAVNVGWGFLFVRLALGVGLVGLLHALLSGGSVR